LLADWSDLERRGLIMPSPGREEAARKTLAKVAARKAVEIEARKPAERK
jgi:hypothetical protein